MAWMPWPPHPRPLSPVVTGARGGLRDQRPVWRAADGSPRVGRFRSSGFPARVLPFCVWGAGILASREAAKGNAAYSYPNSFDCSAVLPLSVAFRYVRDPGRVRWWFNTARLRLSVKIHVHPWLKRILRRPPLSVAENSTPPSSAAEQSARFNPWRELLFWLCRVRQESREELPICIRCSLLTVTAECRPSVRRLLLPGV